MRDDVAHHVLGVGGGGGGWANRQPRPTAVTGRVVVTTNPRVLVDPPPQPTSCPCEHAAHRAVVWSYSRNWLTNISEPLTISSFITVSMSPWWAACQSFSNGVDGSSNTSSFWMPCLASAGVGRRFIEKAMAGQGPVTHKQHQQRLRETLSTRTL